MFNRFIQKPEQENEQDANVRIRILPSKGIGGVGHAGDTAWMTQEEADRWVAEGYVEILPDADEPVPSVAADAVEESELLDPTVELMEALINSDEQPAEPAEEDHQIWQPENKRD